MSEVARFLAELYEVGVRLARDGDTIHYDAPTGALTPALRDQIRSRKSEILSFLERARPSIQREIDPHNDVVECTDASAIQKAIYWTDKLDSPGAYTEAFAVIVDSRISTSRLRRAWQEVTNRHELLRAGFEFEDGRLRIVVHQSVAAEFTELQLSSADTDEEAQIRRASNEAVARSFDLTSPPLARLIVANLTDDRTVLVCVIHHIICDLWSCTVLLRDLIHFYGIEKSDCSNRVRPSPSARYSDYVKEEAQRRCIGTDALSGFWKRQLENSSSIINFPLKPKCLSSQDPLLPQVKRVLTAEEGETLRALARRSGTTISNVFLTALASVLYRYSNQECVTIAVPINRRSRLEFEHVVGPFINTLPVCVHLSGSTRFSELLSQVHHVVAKTLAHSQVGLPDLLRYFPNGDMGSGIVPVNVGYVFHGTVLPILEWGRSRVDYFELEVVNPKFDLQVSVNDLSETLELTFQYRQDRLDSRTVSQIADGTITIVQDVDKHPQAMIDELMILPTAEREKIWYEFNDTFTTLGDPCKLHQIRHREGHASSDPAIRYNNNTVTYEELESRIASLVHELVRLGVSDGDLVGVVLNNPIDQIVAQFAVLDSGGVFVPLSCDDPPARVQDLVRHAEPAFLIVDSDSDLIHLMSDEPQTKILEGGVLVSFNPGRRPLVDNDLAYVIYTSGSTGTPKGVMNNHKGVTNTILDVLRRFEVGRRDSVFALSRFAFDLSIFDVFGLLGAGGTVVPVDSSRRLDPASWYRTIRESSVTIWNSVPALMEMFLEYIYSRNLTWPESLRLVLLSGDWIPVTLPRRIREKSGRVEVVSLGGATEASIWSVFYSIEAVESDWHSIPYGRPLANQRCYVLNSKLEPCPVGVAGDLYIGGAGLSSGYLWDEIATKEAFIQHSELGRLYRSGDKARYYFDGTLEFLGRESGFSKILGNRIDVNEITAALQMHPHVRNCAVVIRGDGSSQVLVAFVVPADAHDFNETILANYMRERLSPHMIPSRFCTVDQLPLTDNGKVDVRRLEKLVPGAGSGQVVSETSSLEERLMRLCEQILESPIMGVDDDFFALGGNSLSATELSSMIFTNLGVDIPVPHIFELRTVRRIAARVENIQWLKQSISNKPFVN